MYFTRRKRPRSKPCTYSPLSLVSLCSVLLYYATVTLLPLWCLEEEAGYRYGNLQTSTVVLEPWFIPALFLQAIQFLQTNYGERDKLRASRNAISAADIANEFMLGEPGQPFAFYQCHNKITVTDASGMTGEISLEHFIREHITEHLFKSVRIWREVVNVLRTLLSLPYEVKRWRSTVCFRGCLGCQSGSNRGRMLKALSEKGFPFSAADEGFPRPCGKALLS